MDVSPTPPPPRVRASRRRPLLVCAVVALVPAAVCAVLLTSRAAPHRAAAAPPPSATATPTPVVTTAPAPVVPHAAVAPAAPTVFTLSGPRFTIRAHVCSMPAVFPLDPPGEQHHTVCWVKKGFGARPGSDTATSYILGHSWAPDPQEVLNQASSLATREILAAKPVKRDGVDTFPVHALDGYRIVLHTPAGVLTYRVHDTYGVAKDRLGDVSSTMDQNVRNRVVVITCAERRGVDYHYNVVITAYLWSSQAA